MTITNCSLCGGTHYGSHKCPYRCGVCRVNTEECNKNGCPRNARWLVETERHKMTDEIKTPRTDAMKYRYTVDDGFHGSDTYEVVKADFARQLERDLALVTQERDALRKKLEEAYERAEALRQEKFSVLKTEGT